MAVESAEELAGFFDPDEFGTPMMLHGFGYSLEFNGIVTTSAVAVQPGTTATITDIVPVIIVRRLAVPDIQQGDKIELPGGQRVEVVDIKTKGDLVTIHYHDMYDGF